MSFSRINYDESAYDLKMERSKAPGDYRLFPNSGEHCKQVYPYNDPTNAKSQVSLVKKDDDLTYGEMAQVESLLTRLLKEINRSKATSPTPTQKLAVAKNLTIMGISDREIMETRPYNQRVNLVAGNGNAFDAFGMEDGGDDDDMGGDKDEGEQLTREKIKKASSTLATQHDKSKRKSKYKTLKRLSKKFT